MYERNEAVQKMIDWIEENLTESPSLIAMSSHIGYSPQHCSRMFHDISGMTIKDYIAGRRLSRATMEIRDTDGRLLDIALKYGYSSHEALTRAFVTAYGCTPSAYRRHPLPLPLSIRQVVLSPEHYQDKGENEMSKNKLADVHVRVEHIPAHRYVGIFDITASGYGDFWEKHDCDAVCGIIESMSNVAHKIVTPHTAGWFWEGGRRGYFYGFGVPDDYSGEVPEGFEVRDIPASDYLVFFHPPFDYLADNGDVMGRVENLAWNYDPSKDGYEWNEAACNDYQRHYPEVLGYQILRPVKRVK